ncbi:MAG TPA: hypothetical protein VGX27_08745 [Candidatus Dormibacteraeota bacterium]|nr:hypothetical protein [Candidatus Dormibacteraeota bacterium]
MTTTFTRTRPIGRLARLALAAAYAVSLVSITGPRLSAQFRNPHILGEIGPWILLALMLLTYVLLAGAVGFAFGGAASRRRWQIGAVVVAVAAALVAVLATFAINGTGWGFPVADLVWWFDVAMLIEGLVALLLSVAVGLPGCEIGVWPMFISRARGTAPLPEEGLACVVGLHYLDAWEARRRLAS